MSPRKKVDPNPIAKGEKESKSLFQKALRVLPGGVSRNTIFRRPHPYYVEKASGCYVTEIDGVKRVDFANNMASLIHGHAHPAIVKAVTRQMKRGTAFAMATEAEIRFAQLLCDRVPGFKKVRFVNSGTEAVMVMVKASRAFTRKEKIAKVEGAYHGTYDYAEVSQTAGPENWGDENSPNSVPVARGTPLGVLNDTVIIPFNDPQRAIAILNRHAGEIAGVLIDPLPHRVGLIPATDEFINAIYQWTRENDALLLFDEVISFRTAVGGAQECYRVRPDLTALGKIIGGGFPGGAIAGRDDVMKVMNPMQYKLRLPHSGTFSANPITMTAGRIALEMFNREALKRLNALADKAKKQIEEAIQTVGLDACVTGAGSMFRIHLKPEAPKNYRAAWMDQKTAGHIKFLLDQLHSDGILMINSCSAALSTVMTKKEIDRLSDAMLKALIKLKKRYR